MFARKLLLSTLMVLSFILASCNLPAGTPVPTASEVASVAAINSPVPTETPTLEPTATFTPLPTQTPIPTETPTSTSTAIPTYVILRGKVLQRANCRYGSGAAYLYKYGLVAGSVMDIIGRNEDGSWIQMQAIGGDNPCWVNAELIEVRGDVMTVQPIAPDDLNLPQSPYYYPPKSVSAMREGSEVTIFWSPVPMTEDKNRGYLLELWLCQGGKLVFTPIHSDSIAEKVTDESGCSEPSHGRIYTAEKHGYTAWKEIPWP